MAGESSAGADEAGLVIGGVGRRRWTANLVFEWSI